MALVLDDAALKKEPEEVFDLLDKLGEGSYGAVHRALHRDSGTTIAIKIVAVDSDLQDIIKEISIMQQCDSVNVVKYFGSYFHSSDLWIVMEYCGGGSVADIMRLRKKTMTEPQIRAILKGTLQGLAYLHSRNKIHRDIKAGNVLLSESGEAKLADFGVAGQLSDTMAKRNTVIGTPYWMAPEVIQEIGHDVRADMWSLGITALEMAEGKPPHAHVHPMRAIFMIPISPAPKLQQPERWSEGFSNFLALCLCKNPSQRALAPDHLTTPFIADAPAPSKVLVPIITEAAEIMRERGRYPSDEEEENDNDSDAEAHAAVDSGTIVAGGTMVVRSDEDFASVSGTMVQHDLADDGTMQCNTVKHTSSYKPPFMAHFDNVEDASLDKTLDAGTGPIHAGGLSSSVSSSSVAKALSPDELRQRLKALEPEKEEELAELARLYQAKREPILKAIEAKRAMAAS